MSDQMTSDARLQSECFRLKWLPRPIALGCRRQTWHAAPLSNRMRHGLSDAAPHWRGPAYLLFV
eukprot:6203443-Pleurochrysis_carterae.AAC.1